MTQHLTDYDVDTYTSLDTNTGYRVFPDGSRAEYSQGEIIDRGAGPEVVLEPPEYVWDPDRRKRVRMTAGSFRAVPKEKEPRQHFGTTPAERELDREIERWKEREKNARNDRDFEAAENARAKREALEQRRVELAEAREARETEEGKAREAREAEESKSRSARQTQQDARQAEQDARQAEQDAAQRAFDRDKFQADEAYRKALLALQQGNAAEAKRQFNIAEGFKQRYETAKLQFELQRDPVSFVSKLYALSGQEPPGGELDLSGALRPFGGGEEADATTAGPLPAVRPLERPWWENYSNERLMRFPDEELMLLPPEVLAGFPNEFFLERPALMAFLTPDRIRGEGRWQGTGFAQEVIDKFGKGAPVPKMTAMPQVQEPSNVGEWPYPTPEAISQVGTARPLSGQGPSLTPREGDIREPDFRIQPQPTPTSSFTGAGAAPTAAAPIAPAPNLGRGALPAVSQPSGDDVDLQREAEAIERELAQFTGQPRFQPGRLPHVINF